MSASRPVVLLLLASALALTGCSSIDAGTITAKENEPERRYVCTVKPLIFCTDDEDWRFDITEGDDNGWVYVDESTFAEYEIGDYYPKGTR